MTLAQLSITVALLGALGLAASRLGLSAIPAYLLGGLLLGPNEPRVLSVIEPSEVTDFVAELGVIFLLFFLGLEFTLDRLRRSGMHIGLGGSIDLVVNAGLGLLVGVVAFGFSVAAVLLAAAIYVSSSAVTVKGLIDFRRLADDETDLVLAILIFEDVAVAFVLAFAGGGGGELAGTLALVGKAIGFIALSLAVALSVAGKLAGTYAAARVGGFTARQGVNAGAALVARGEFTVILAQVAAANGAIAASARRDLVAFAGLYVLATALIGVLLMKESKRLGRRLFPAVPRLAAG